MADGTDALSQDDVKELAATLNRFCDVAEKQLAAQAAAPGGSPVENRNTNRIDMGGAGVWIAVLAALFAWNASRNAEQRMTDLRIDMQAERVSREIHTRWAAQEVTAIRSYITTGKLAPMNPPPVAEPEKKEAQ